ncbi:MAG: PepSY domain-containing protein [Methylobacter sp.]|jgi:uncharacterized iron-regulated membrane protein|nr:PepSY domain-containing protein [Methylobacter sp.]
MDITLKSRRKLWLKVHLYLGLFAGAVFVLIGLTGSLLAFEDVIDAWLNPKLMIAPAPDGNKEFLPLDEIVKSGMKALPNNGKILDLGFPMHTKQTFDLWFKLPSPKADYSDRHQIFINPYTAEVTGQRLLIDFERPWRDPFMDFILRLHYSMALGKTGMNAVGFIGLALLFSVLTGLILWWPHSGKFAKALSIKRNASSERLNFDVHKTFGFYSAIILLFLIASGVYMIFPEYGRGLIGIFSPVPQPWPRYQSVIPVGDKTPLSLTEVKRVTDARFPDGEYRRIVFPQNEQDVYFISKRANDEVNQKHAYRRLWIDQYSGNILHVRERSTRTAGEIVEEWLYPLHTGEAFGFAGQVIILILGLTPLILYVTGVIRWLQKNRAVRKKWNKYEVGDCR